MKNIMDIMQKANAIQKKIEDSKEKLKYMEFSSSSGGGLVTITINGNYEIKKINIDDSLININEKEILIDLIIAAHNDVKNKVKEENDARMKDLTSILPLPPGIKLPGLF